MILPPSPPLRPTLWRAGRVLAHRTRLRLLQLLIECQDQTVCVLARHMRRPVSAVSANLRALEARGLLRVPSAGPWVAKQAKGSVNSIGNY
ncbi:MAG: helix-turn-helix domain-containing protein [Verrucomicrobia bacterium]|nr:helix-turn-helix domain-containing protein [Verrucomicrobiota bacterium]